MVIGAAGTVSGKDAAVVAEADMVFVEPGAQLQQAPAQAVVWSALSDGAELAADHWPTVFPLSASPGAAPGALWVPGPAPTAAALSEAETVDAESRAVSPREPTPPAARGALFALVRACRSRAVLELGTGDGATTILLADALRASQGRLVTVDRDSARRTRAVRHLTRAGLAKMVDLRLGEAQRIVPRLEERFDLIVLDAVPADRAEHLALVLPACRRGAIVVSCGAVAHAPELAAYQATVRTHALVQAEMTIAAGDGLALALLRR